jgi:hypothetical protein
MRKDQLTMIVVGAVLGMWVTGCAGKGNDVGKSKSSRTSSDKIGKAEPVAQEPAPSEYFRGDDEIVPTPEMPKVEIKSGEDIPTDSDALRSKAKAELESGNTDDALSMIDVLLIVNPDDAELFEIRSDILQKKGLEEDAKVDRARCCKLGRASCCP